MKGYYDDLHKEGSRVRQLESDNAVMREALEQFLVWAQNDISIYGGGGQHVGTPKFTGRRVAEEVKSMCDRVLATTLAKEGDEA